MRVPIVAGLVLSLAGVTTALSAQTSLTIYQDGRILVRKTVDAAVPTGASTHRLALGELDPATLFSLDPTLRVTRVRYDASVDEKNTLRRAIGTTLAFVRNVGREADTVRAVVLGVDPERYRLPDGSVTFSRPGVPLYPASLVQVEPTMVVDIVAAARRNGFPLGFFTGGASWQASYQVVLAKGGAARFAGAAVIPSDRLSVDSAEVQLLAGSVRRAGPPGPRFAMDEIAMASRAAKAQEGMETPEGVGEAYLYTVPGTVTLRPGVTTSAALFEPVAVSVEKTYTVQGEIPWMGYLPQNGDESRVPVEVTWVLARKARTDFGDRPLPGGVARLYEEDTAGRPQLVGEASFGHTAPAQDLRLSAAYAFDLTARRVQTSYRTQRDSLRTTAIADYRVTIANAKDSAVTVDVIERRAGDWAIVTSSIRAERTSSTEAVFRVRVPARGEATLTYRVRVTW